MSAEIKIGDVVTRKGSDRIWNVTVEKILSGRNGIGEPVAVFEEGGYWRVSQLRKVN